MEGGFTVLKTHVISQLLYSLSASYLRMRCKHSATTLQPCLPALTVMGRLLSKIMSKPLSYMLSFPCCLCHGVSPEG